MAKYKEYTQRMMETNKEAFDRFRKIHDKYCLMADKESFQDKYNEEGAKIMEIIEEWEQRLCSSSEKAGYGSYSGSLAEKFYEEIKKIFPMIDQIGLIIEKFEIKKINLY
jgi:gamma-glutamylcysteine synthetase